MTLIICQLGAMIRYEMILVWRRRGLLIITLAILAITTLILVSSKSQVETGRQQLVQAGLSVQDVGKQTTLGLLPTYWGVLFTILLITLPVVLVDSIPIDRQVGVRELFDTMPLNSATYLTGKLLGVWAAALSAIVIVMLGSGLVWWLVLGPFEISYYLEVWLVGAIPGALINAGMVIFLVIGQPSRRGALLVGVAFSIVLLLLLGRSLDMTTGNSPLLYLNPAHPILFLYYLVGHWTNTAGVYAGHLAPELVGSPSQVALTLLVSMAELAVLWSIAWLWLRFREHR